MQVKKIVKIFSCGGATQKKLDVKKSMDGEVGTTSPD